MVVSVEDGGVYKIRGRGGAAPARRGAARRDGMAALGGADVQHDFADAGDMAVDAVARDHRADAFGRAGEDQIARLQVIEQRQVGDLLADIPDQHVDVGLLARLAVDGQRELAAVDHAGPASARSRRPPTTARHPCPGPRAGPCRARPAAGRAASCPDRRHSRRSARAASARGDPKPGLADRQHQLHLVVVVGGLGRVGDGGARSPASAAPW